MEALPVGLVVLVVLFGVYVASKFREMATLRGMLRQLDQRTVPPPDLGQFEKLFGMVERSQQGYRDLIDTFEDLLFSLSMNGEILAANRSVADLLGHSFGELMGRPLDSFVDITDGTGRAAALDKLLPALPDERRRQWSGVLQRSAEAGTWLPRAFSNAPCMFWTATAGITASASWRATSHRTAKTKLALRSCSKLSRKAFTSRQPTASSKNAQSGPRANAWLRKARGHARSSSLGFPVPAGAMGGHTTRARALRGHPRP